MINKRKLIENQVKWKVGECLENEKQFIFSLVMMKIHNKFISFLPS